MQFERLNNIPEIAGKYNIEYSKTDLSNEYKSLQELTQFKVNIPTKDLKMFEEWFSQKPSKNRRKAERKASLPRRENGR